MRQKITPFERRRQRVRTSIRKTSGGKPRLSIHRSSKHMYAQVIDDKEGVTLAAASTVEKDLRSSTGATTDAASAVGKLIAERAKKAGVEKVVFDRGGFLYHGRVKALADAARDGGLQF
ncbi:MAG: 50S ribosomal protein L18 [Pseudomonadota bacterium]